MEFSSSRWIFYITSFVYQSVTAKNVARVRYCRISTGLKGRSDLGLIWASRFSALLHWLSPLKGSANTLGCHLKWWTKVWCLFFGPFFLTLRSLLLRNKHGPCNWWTEHPNYFWSHGRAEILCVMVGVWAKLPFSMSWVCPRMRTTVLHFIPI